MTPSTQDARATGLVELAKALEAANPSESREWLEQAFYAVNPAPECGTPERTVWVARSFRFHALIEAGGFLDAAMSLVPENPYNTGERFQVESWTTNGVHAEHVRASAWVSGSRRVFAATPALALTASALRALAASTKDQNDG